MPTPDKLPEARNTAPAVNPTEGGVSQAAIAAGAKLETKTQLAGLDADIRQGQTTDEIVTAAVATAVDTASSGAASSSTKGKSKMPGGWGALSGVGDFFTQISDTFTDLGKQFSEWLKGIMGNKDGKSGEGADPDIDDDDDMDANLGTDLLPSPVSPERSIEDNEMLTSNAPVFTFLKSYTGTVYASDVPRIRKIHPVSGKPNAPHEGVDIPAPIGTPLHLTNSMTILSKVGSTLRGRLDDGTVVSFLHLNKMTSAEVGDRLPRGAWFADVGNKGGSTGPHLHFEVNEGETDPIPYLDAGLIVSAESKIQQKKDKGEWIPLESDEHAHGLT